MTRKAFIVFHLKNTNSLSLDKGLVITDFNVFVHTHGQSVGVPLLLVDHRRLSGDASSIKQCCKW